MPGAASLTRQLVVLSRRHGVPTSPPSRLPLAPPPTHPSLILEGIASAPDIDVDRVRFAPFCFGKSLPASLPLLIEHNHPAGTATVHYDSQGTLHCRTSPLSGDAARYPAFSIGARVLQYSIVDADYRSSFHAEVLAAELTEISLTQYPHLPAARVLQRTPPAASDAFHDLMLRKVDALSRLTAVLLTIQKEATR